MQVLKIFMKKIAIGLLSPSMRSPSGITGWFARRLMRMSNPESTRHAIQNRLNLESSDVFLELGAGEGAGVLAVMGQKSSTTIPFTMHLVEISDAMRYELERVVTEALPKSHETRIEIHSDDCKSMPYLADGSVDKIFGMNVVYFLDPLEEYLTEINRVLKVGGVIVWGCKFDKVPKDNDIFVNVDIDVLKSKMQDAGFRVSTEFVDVVGAMEQRSAVEAGENMIENDHESSRSDMRNYMEVKGQKL